MVLLPLGVDLVVIKKLKNIFKNIFQFLAHDIFQNYFEKYRAIKIEKYF